MYFVPGDNFIIADDSLPSDWLKGEYDAYGEAIVIKTFPEWAKDNSFFEKLWDDDKDVKTIFRKYAEKYEKAARDFKLN